MFYKIDSTRATLREYWWECRAPWLWPVLFIAVLFKWLRIRVPASCDVANVDALAPFRISDSDLSDEVREKFLPMENEFVELGFHSPVYHAIDDGLQGQQIRFSTFCHESGQALARVHLRIFSMNKASQRTFYPMFITPFEDGSFLVTNGARPDVLLPPECQVICRLGASPAELWASHQQSLLEGSAAKLPRLIKSQDNLLEAAEGFHALNRDFQVHRGFFVPMTAEQEKKAVENRERFSEPTVYDDESVLQEIENQQQRTRSWVSAIVILGISLLLFISLGSTVWEWRLVLLLLPILFLHELGHFAAMRLFKYRNLKMFFIPLFGAAVSGSHYNVPGWKRVVVSLMGPLPGILFALPLGIVGLLAGYPLLVEAAVLMFILNGLNLLPVLPLDGGWIANVLLFSRHYLLEFAFYLIAVGLLFWAGMALDDRLLLFLAVFMLLGLRWTYRRGKIAHTLLRSGFQAASPDDQTIPRDTALEIVGEVRKSFPLGLSTKQAASLSLQVFERLNSRPPSVLASLALAAVYVTSFLSAVVFVAAIVFFQQGIMGNLLSAMAVSAEHPLSCDSVQNWRGNTASDPGHDVAVVVGTLASRDEAEALFDTFSSELPPDASMTLFGQSVFIALSADDDAARKRWLEEMESLASDVYVDTPDFRGPLDMVCVAPSAEAAAEIEQLCSEYLFCDKEMYLVPPWSTRYEITPTQRKARRTHKKLRTEFYEAYYDERLADMHQKLQRATRRGDNKAIEELRQQQLDLTEQVLIDWQQKLRDQDDLYDPDVVDLYQTQPKWEEPEVGADTVSAGQEEEYQAKYTRWSRQLGAMLGQLPLEGDRPAPQDAQQLAESGLVTHVGTTLTIRSLTFERVDRGAPEFVAWLCRLGCTEIAYSLGNDFFEQVD